MAKIYDDTLFVDQEKKLGGFRKLLQPETRQAVMLIQATKDMGKTWLAGRMQDHCLRPDVNLPAVYIDFRNPKEENQDYLGLVRLIRDQLNAPAYFNQLNDVINTLSEALVTPTTGLGKLLEKLVQAFNLEEIRELCLDLSINYEELSGDNLRVKSRELIEYCQRRGLLSNLLTRCEELRTHLDWWEGLESYRDEAPVADTGATPTDAIVVDQNTPLRLDNDQERGRAERQINEAFFAGLSALIGEQSPSVLLFDSYESIKPEADRWLRDELLPRVRDEELMNLVVIITGRHTPDLSDLSMRPFLVQTSLEPFTAVYVQEYFERRQISSLDLDWRTITVTSGGVPGTLAVMADHAMATAQDDDDFFSDV
jgi:hypothetical protein